MSETSVADGNLIAAKHRQYDAKENIAAAMSAGHGHKQVWYSMSAEAVCMWHLHSYRLTSLRWATQ